MAHQHSGYQVYLNVVRADLPSSHTSAEADVTYAKVYVDDHKKHLQTKHSASTHDPMYNQEFVLNVPRPDSTISVKIKSHHRVTPNKTVGIARFHLSDLEDGVAEERTVSMEGGGSVTVILSRRSNPSLASPKLSDDMHLRLGSLRIVLEKQEYYPGDVIRGFVRYFERQKVAISGVRLAFEGRSLVHWTDHSGNHSTTYQSSAPLLEYTTMLYGSQDYKKKEKVGPHFLIERAFEFQLPKDLAPSIRPHSGDYGHSSNDYRVIAFVHRDGRSNKRTHASFRILNPPSAARLDVVSGTATKLAEQGDANIQISAPRTFFRGKPYEVNIVLDNTKGTKTIESLKFKLKYSRHAYAKSGKMTKRKWSHKVYSMKMSGSKSKTSGSGFEKHKTFHNESDLLPVKPGERREGVVRLIINEPIQPSMNSAISPILHTSYHLKTKIKSSGGKRAKVKLPVMGMEERDWAENHNASATPQCRVWTPPSQVLSTPYLVPINSTDGKKIDEHSSNRRGIFNFGAFGEPTQSPLHAGHDSKFMHAANYRIKDKHWSVGRVPKWVKSDKFAPGYDPHHPSDTHHAQPVMPHQQGPPPANTTTTIQHVYSDGTTVIHQGNARDAPAAAYGQPAGSTAMPPTAMPAAYSHPMEPHNGATVI